MSNVVGYFGVVIPKLTFWQGYYINDGVKDIAERMIEVGRQAAAIQSGSETINKTPGVRDEDQSLFGTLCAIAVDGAFKGARKTVFQQGVFVPVPPDLLESAQLSAAALAITMISRTNFFIIEGHPEHEGYRTIFHPMPFFIANPDAARDYINNHEMIKPLKEALMNSAVQSGKRPKSS